MAVLGAYEVGANGDLANWKLAGRKGGGIGGAMDIAACAQRVFVMMEHTTRNGGAACWRNARCRSRRRAASIWS